MLPIESLGLSANQWQFLKQPDRYVQASKGSDRELVLESTRRQFLTARDILARLNGSQGEQERQGILLADDVGLGKTTVAALVAWIVACAGRRVRILAPNRVMRQRWVKELRLHVGPLQECAKHLGVQAKQVKDGKGPLKDGWIRVVTHYYAAQGGKLDCDLLIIDEAHRAKGERGRFRKKLMGKKHARRVLILTATPFSIHLAELNRMLKLVGGKAAHGRVTAYDKALNKLYSGNTVGDCEVMAEQLTEKARAAVEAIAPFVIRHGIDDLLREQKSFGARADWTIDVPPAKPEELELLMRMDRALGLKKDGCSELSKATTDARFHVGWRHFDEERERLKREVPRLAEPTRAVVEHQVKSIQRLLCEVGTHPKMQAVADMVKSTVAQGEKVVLFCHYHATARELTAHLGSADWAKVTASQAPGPAAWTQAWGEVLKPAGEERHAEILRKTFIEWLCADLIRAQTWHWLRAAGASVSEVNLVAALKKTSARDPDNPETIADAAQRLYSTLLQSKSSKAVLLRANEDGLEILPGANGGARVLGVCDPSENEDEESLFLHNQQPDTLISIFNSPFGPDVLVVTDKFSEGIDLHRYCRHLIHYELDPSPIHTVQRNGRLRRVNSWAAVTRQPILYAYPAFRGTRDHQLVKIMKKRINTFSLLLGGVHDIKGEDLEASDDAEKWRDDVIALAKKKGLEKAGGQLCATEPGGT